MFALLAILIIAKLQSLTLPYQHVDGAFQTASGLDRLANGQWPGRHFLPYLGLGPLYLPLPLHWAAGANLASAGFAAQSMVYIADALGIVLILRLVGVRAAFSSAFIVAFVGLLVLRGLASQVGENLGVFLFDQLMPGSSMRALRSFGAYVAAAAAWLLVSRPLSLRARLLLGGFVNGGITWWSNDYGPASALCLFVFAMLMMRRARALDVGGFLLYSAATAAGFLLTIAIGTAFDPLPLLQFNFRDVAIDQWWYYGPWSANTRLLGLADVVHLFSWQAAVGVLALAVVVYRLLRAPTLEHAVLVLLGAALAIGGLVAAIGGHAESKYQNSLAWWGAIVMLALLARPAAARLAGRVPLAVPLVVAGLGLAGAGALYAVQSHRLQQRSDLVHVPELGGYLPAGWRDYVELARRYTGAPVVEEYWGLWSAMRHSHGLVVDSVIHALGHQRERATAQMHALPETVISSAPAAAGDWVAWSISANWWFHAALFARYVPVAQSPLTIVWRRSEAAQDWPAAGCEVDAGGRAYRVRTDGRAGLYEVSIRYRLGDAGRKLLFARNRINRAEESDGWLSIDPKSGQSTFPVLLGGAEGDRIELRTLPEQAASALELLQCQARRVVVDPRAEVAFPWKTK